MQQAAARENKDNKEVKERAERARAAKAEREGAAATAEAYKSALGLAAKHDWGAAKPKAAPAGALASFCAATCMAPGMGSITPTHTLGLDGPSRQARLGAPPSPRPHLQVHCSGHFAG